MSDCLRPVVSYHIVIIVQLSNQVCSDCESHPLVGNSTKSSNQRYYDLFQDMIYPTKNIINCVKNNTIIRHFTFSSVTFQHPQ